MLFIDICLTRERERERVCNQHTDCECIQTFFMLTHCVLTTKLT